MLAVAPADAQAPIEVVVKDAYIDLHTGPGRDFPVTISVERGVTIELLRQRTDWIEVRTARGQRGWVHRSQLENTLTPAGSEVHIAGPGQDARTEHQWEAGVAVGEFDGSRIPCWYAPTFRGCSATRRTAGSARRVSPRYSCRNGPSRR